MTTWRQMIVTALILAAAVFAATAVARLAGAEVVVGPAVPAGARMVGQQGLDSCDPAGRWTFYHVPGLSVAPDEWHLVVLGRVLADGTDRPIVYFWWDAGDASQAREGFIVWPGRPVEQLPMDAIAARWPRPCDLLRAMP